MQAAIHAAMYAAAEFSDSILEGAAAFAQSESIQIFCDVAICIAMYAAICVVICAP